MNFKLHGSRLKALKNLAIMLAIAACGFTPLSGVEPYLRFIFYAMPLIAGVLSVPIIRVLIGLPILEAGRGGILSSSFARSRFTKWADVRGLKVSPIVAGKHVIPALHILTVGRPIVITQTLLRGTVEDAYRRLSQLPEFQTVLNQGSPHAPDAQLSDQAAGAFAEVAARSKAARPVVVARSPARLKFAGLALVIFVAGFGQYMKHQRTMVADRAVASLRQALAPHLCEAANASARRCYQQTTVECETTMGYGIESCVASLNVRNRNRARDPARESMLRSCAMQRYARRHQARLMSGPECAAVHQAFIGAGAASEVAGK